MPHVYRRLASRLKNRVQISTDAMVAYPEAIELAFGIDVDYAQIVKAYASEDGGKRAYAWSHMAGKSDKETTYVAVLELPSVTSPETAVKAAIMAEIKNAREKEKGR